MEAGAPHTSPGHFTMMHLVLVSMPSTGRFPLPETSPAASLAGHLCFLVLASANAFPAFCAMLSGHTAFYQLGCSIRSGSWRICRENVGVLCW